MATIERAFRPLTSRVPFPDPDDDSGPAADLVRWPAEAADPGTTYHDDDETGAIYCHRHGIRSYSQHICGADNT